jgi:tetratricopeptide (TPR) repeat protein
VPADRDATIKKADRLRKQGKLAGAIAEYERLLGSGSADWASINALGDLYAEAGQRDKAIAQFRRVGDHLFDEGFHPRAAGVYKKMLKVRGDDDHALSRLASIAERQRLPFEARAYLERLVAARNGRRDEVGAAEVLVRLAGLDAAGEPSRGSQRTRPPLPRPVEAAVETGAGTGPPAEETAPGALDDQAVPPAGVTAPQPDGPQVPESPGAAPTPAPPALADVFGAMRARVEGDAASRARAEYERAVQCLDEGRVAEGVSSLEEAARAPFVRFEAASRLGRLFAERGELARAVDWMERASEAPAPTPEEGTELRYDLADVLEQVGERARALALLRAIEADVGTYRDVRERIDWLTETDADGGHA